MQTKVLWQWFFLGDFIFVSISEICHFTITVVICYCLCAAAISQYKWGGAGGRYWCLGGTYLLLIHEFLDILSQFVNVYRSVIYTWTWFDCPHYAQFKLYIYTMNYIMFMIKSFCSVTSCYLLIIDIPANTLSGLHINVIMLLKYHMGTLWNRDGMLLK